MSRFPFGSAATSRGYLLVYLAFQGESELQSFIVHAFLNWHPTLIPSSTWTDLAIRSATLAQRLKTRGQYGYTVDSAEWSSGSINPRWLKIACAAEGGKPYLSSLLPDLLVETRGGAAGLYREQHREQICRAGDFVADVVSNPTSVLSNQLHSTR